MIRSIYRNLVKHALERLSRGEKVDFTASLIKKSHAADIAELIANLSDERQINAFQNLEDERMGKVFSELPEDLQEELVHEIDDQHLISMFKDLPPDEAVDLLNMLEEDERESLLETLPEQVQWNLRRLLLYGQESAGGIMTPMLLMAREQQTTAEVIDALRKYGDQDEVFLNIFVVNPQGKLIGVVPLQSLVVASPDTKIATIMDLNPIAISVHSDQEVVAQIVSKYNLLVVPVIDENEKLLGRITLDDVMEVMQSEADEDVYLMAGMDSEEVHVDSAVKVAMMRLPWLLTCLLGSLISAAVIGSYQETLQSVLGLIFFLPAICAMGGNSGLQTSTVTIRNLAYGLVFYKNVRKVVRRELFSGILIGIACGIVVGCVGGLWLNGIIFGAIIGISMLFTVMISTCTGIFFPMLFKRLGIDPAVASGPMITTLNDATSALTYLTMATVLLRFFHVL